MFGYIGPEKCEIKVKDWTLYQAYYCGLCRTIGQRYGQAPRLTLSYDCTFIGILLSSFSPCAGCSEHRCAYKPMKKAQPMANSSPSLDFAADLNVLLAWYQCRDEWTDEKRLRGAIGEAAFSLAGKKAGERRPGLYSAISEGIGQLSEIEKANCSDLDAPADAFASMMKNCLLCADIPDKQKKAAGALIYHLGKWVYLMDAWDDREKDRKSGAYNVFLSAGAEKDRASFLLNASLNEAIKAYTLLDIISAKGILDNIFFEGCVSRTKNLLKAGGENEQ